MTEHFEFTEETIKDAEKVGAKKELFGAMMDEMTDILPQIKGLYAESRTSASRALTVAGLVALEKRLGTIDPEKVKAFVQIGIEYAEVAGGFFASLPCVKSHGLAKWYKQSDKRYYKRERPLIESEILPLIPKSDLLSFLNEIQRQNEELSDKYEQGKAESDKLDALCAQ